MQYDFDTLIDRRNTASEKWDFVQYGENLDRTRPTNAFFGDDPILPMWVADMDFACPPAVVQALQERVGHPIYGYTDKADSYFAAVTGWMQRRHGWTVTPEWIVTTPGVVPALNLLVRTVVRSGEKVLVQTPVYYPFYGAIANNNAEIVRNPLVLEEGRYRMDFDDLEAKCADPAVTMAILSNPHNPVGRVWSREELTQFGEICSRNGVLVVADEIHGDLIMPGSTFTPFGTLAPKLAEKAVICTAPSKTFNLAGLQTSNIIIADPDMRTRFEQTLTATGLFGLNPFGKAALEAAYTHGEEWLGELLEYLSGNLDYIEKFIAREIPSLSVIRPEGTYLVWLDCRRLGLGRHVLRELMFEKARVYFDEGFIFGPEGDGFERINIACPRSIVVKAMERIQKAVLEFEKR
jgi:cystathionine beta-lyase